MGVPGDRRSVNKEAKGGTVRGFDVVERFLDEHCDCGGGVVTGCN